MQVKNTTPRIAPTMRNTWHNMMKRCFYPGMMYYCLYGGRGITVCERLQNLDCFIQDMSPKPTPSHTLDRIDSNGHYSCGTCAQCIEKNWEPNLQWATPTEQTRNRSNTRMVAYQGKTLPVAEWAEIFHMTYQTLKHRLRRGWSIERALCQQVRKR